MSEADGLDKLTSIKPSPADSSADPSKTDTFNESLSLKLIALVCSPKTECLNTKSKDSLSSFISSSITSIRIVFSVSPGLKIIVPDLPI